MLRQVERGSSAEQSEDRTGQDNEWDFILFSDNKTEHTQALCEDGNHKCTMHLYDKSLQIITLKYIFVDV